MGALKMSVALITCGALSGCSLFGPPLPAPPPDPALTAVEAAPAQARAAFIECAQKYGAIHGRTEGIAMESLVEAALYACRTEFDHYSATILQHEKGGARVLGWIDRSAARAEEAAAAAKAEAQSAALDAAIRARTSPPRAPAGSM